MGGQKQEGKKPANFECKKLERRWSNLKKVDWKDGGWASPLRCALLKYTMKACTNCLCTSIE